MTSLEIVAAVISLSAVVALIVWGLAGVFATLVPEKPLEPPRKLSDTLVDVIACDFTGDDGQRVTITVVPSNADVAHVLMRSSGRRLGAEFKLVAVDGDQSVIEFEFLQIRKGVNQR